MLTIQDRVYGEHTFTSKLIIDLINSPQVQRLKGISQFGPPDKWYFKTGFSRFEHSIGVAILLAKLGASIEVQATGLLHDAGHTAFSHVADWLFGNPEDEGLNDRLYYQTISSGEISSILRRNSIPPSSIKNITDFPILKRNIPNMCADSIDYCLRELIINGQKEKSQQILKNLSVFDEKIIFTSKEPAKLYANEFNKLNNEHWTGWKAVTVYTIMKRMFTLALDNDIITREDFSKTDQHILNKVYSCQIPEIHEDIKILETQTYQPAEHPKKIRFCDPEFLQDEKLIKLSQVDKEFANKIKEIMA
jgi:uncharacterized protein